MICPKCKKRQIEEFEIMCQECYEKGIPIFDPEEENFEDQA